MYFSDWFVSICFVPVSLSLIQEKVTKLRYCSVVFDDSRSILHQQTGWLIAKRAPKIGFSKNSKKVVKMSWKSIFPNLLGMIFSNLTTILARNSINEPKLEKSVDFFSHLLIARFTIKHPVFRACPRQLLVYAIWKEGSHKNRKKVALVSPAMEIGVWKKNQILTKKILICS